MVLLPKPEKDLFLPHLYCPISLLNMDYKLLASILVARLNSFVPRYSHPDQVRFIPGRQLKDNARRIINIMNLVQETKVPSLLFFPDPEKDFDRLEWGFLKTVLANMGFGPSFLLWITLIYFQHTAELSMEGFLSVTFCLS